DATDAALVVPVEVIKDRISIVAAKVLISTHTFSDRAIKNQQSQCALRRTAFWRQNAHVGGNFFARLERGLRHLDSHIELFTSREEDLCPSGESLFRVATRHHGGGREKNISVETRVICNRGGCMAMKQGHGLR